MHMSMVISTSMLMAARNTPTNINIPMSTDIREITDPMNINIPSLTKDCRNANIAKNEM